MHIRTNHTGRARRLAHVTVIPSTNDCTAESELLMRCAEMPPSTAKCQGNFGKKPGGHSAWPDARAWAQCRALNSRGDSMIAIGLWVAILVGVVVILGMLANHY